MVRGGDRPVREPHRTVLGQSADDLTDVAAELPARTGRHDEACRQWRLAHELTDNEVEKRSLLSRIAGG